MLFGTSTIIKLYCQFTKLGLGAASLAGVSVKVNNPANSLIGAGSITLAEIDATNQPGVWEVAIAGAATSLEGSYKAYFHTTDTTVDRQDLEALGYAFNWINNFSLSATLATPITATGVITLRRGDDYYTADGRQIAITIVGGPSLAGATVAFVSSAINKAGTIASNTATFEFSKTDTLVPIGSYVYEIVFTLADGHIVSLAAGALNITP